MIYANHSSRMPNNIDILIDSQVLYTYSLNGGIRDDALQHLYLVV